MQTQTNKRQQSVEQLVINVFDFLAGRKYLLQYYELWRTQKLDQRYDDGGKKQ